MLDNFEPFYAEGIKRHTLDVHRGVVETGDAEHRFVDGYVRDPETVQELAVSLYREGYLSFGKARELAGLSKAEFHRLLGEREVERHYTKEDLAPDIEYVRE